MIDLIIIGAGPAGLTAAIYALRAGLDVKIIEENIYGGQMSITNEIENYPGFESITGAELSNAMYKQVCKMGGEFIFGRVESVDLMSNIKKIKVINKELCAKSIIIANGLKRRTLDCPGEEKFIGKGVSYCATCDGAFFKNKSAVVVGGGNTAVEDALYLANICKKVTIVVRKNYFRAEKYLCNLLTKKDNIEAIMESNITGIEGETTVNSVIIKNKFGQYNELRTDGAFIAIGYKPDNKIYINQVNMDENMYFISDETCSTNIPGVYVAGDCRVKPIKQIVTAASDGAVAGSMAVRFISNME